VIQAIVIRYRARNAYLALMAWRFWTMAPTAAIIIQRVYRGFAGRLEAKVRRKLQWAALMMVSAGFTIIVCGGVVKMTMMTLPCVPPSAMCLPKIYVPQAVYSLQDQAWLGCD